MVVRSGRRRLFNNGRCHRGGLRNSCSSCGSRLYNGCGRLKRGRNIGYSLFQPGFASSQRGLPGYNVSLVSSPLSLGRPRALLLSHNLGRQH